MVKNEKIINLKKEYEEVTNIYQSIFEHIQDPLFLVKIDEKGEFVYKMVNPAYEKLSGLSHEMMKNKKPQELFGEKLGKELKNQYMQCVIKKQQMFYEVKRKHNFTRQKKIWSTTLTPIIIKNKVVELVGSCHDITLYKEENENMKYLSYHDDLTNLYNRRYYQDKLKALDNKEMLPLTLVVGDVNGLKMTNDIFGHQIGDKLLKKTAEIIKKNIRKDDILARWGGDEFCIILPKTPINKAKNIINRINENSSFLEFDICPIYISFGLATKYNINQNIENIFRESEKNMYKNKEKSKTEIDKKLLDSLFLKLKETKEDVIKHTNEMIKLAKGFADYLNFSNEKKELLIKAVKFHDIGRLVTDRYLTKNSDSLAVLKKHAELGYQISKNFTGLSSIANSILHHHEYFDGSGYPLGLSGDSIPTLARIISIIDFYDAILNSKIEHDLTKDINFNQINKEEALVLLEENSGKLFDPKLVDSFIKFIKK